MGNKTRDEERGGAFEGVRARLIDFMERRIYPNEARHAAELAANIASSRPWRPVPLVEELKGEAKRADLWNLWLPKSLGGRCTLTEFAGLCEIMGRVLWASEIFNSSAPDTSTMEMLLAFGTEEQKRRWAKPLLDGDIRTGFAMTEPDVASSDATNIRTSIVRDGDDYVINGRKWWISNAPHERCELFVVMGKTDPGAEKHKQQSMVIAPRDAKGLKIGRALPVFGMMFEPSGRSVVEFENVRVPVTNVLLGEGRGFELAQARLGPGRVHHCMRLIGSAERAIEATCKRLLSRSAFGKAIAEHSVWRERIAEARIATDAARLLVLEAARKLEEGGAKAARFEIAEIKVLIPKTVCDILDMAMQAHGGMGLCDDTFLPSHYAMARGVRIADGPDEVHRETIAKLELKKYQA